MVQDFDPLLGISADREIIDKQQLYPGIILDPLTILIEIFLAIQDDQFIQQITVIHELTAVIPAAGFHTACGKEIGFACTGYAIDSHILSILSEVELQDLLHRSIIIDSFRIDC